MAQKAEFEPVGPEIPIRSRVVPYGLEGVNRRNLPGYILANGIALLESERDASGNYIGGAGWTGCICAPLTDTRRSKTRTVPCARSAR